MKIIKNISINNLSRHLNILGLIFVTVSSFYFYAGSKPLPWNLQTWDGTSPAEIEFLRSRMIDAQYGFGLLILGSFSQLVGMLGKNNK